MLFEREVLDRYGKYLDEQGEDERTHEQLVADFLIQEREGLLDMEMPPGWVMPDQRVAELEMEMGALKGRLRQEEARRATAERLMLDRAHYIPRDQYDTLGRAHERLDQAYAESMASHLRRDEADAAHTRQVTFLKERYVNETAKLRDKLARAYGMLAGGHPPVPDADLARVLYDALLPGGWAVHHGESYNTLDANDQADWQEVAGRVRAKWSTVETQPMSYKQLTMDWGATSHEMLRIETLIQERLPGLERRLPDGTSMGVADTVSAMFDMLAGFVHFGVHTVQSVWPPVKTALKVMGYEWRDGVLHQIDQWEAAEPTQAPQTDVSRVLADRLSATEQAADSGYDRMWSAQAPHADDDFEKAVPVNEVEGPEAAARRFAAELERLAQGLTAEGITLRAGPMYGAAVDSALRAVQGWGNAHLGLATTRTLLDELAARGRRNGWREDDMVCVRELLGSLSEDELTYKTANGRSDASAADER